VPAARPGWLTWPALRWGALAACVVVVGTAVTLHYEWRPEERPHAAAEISAPAASPPTVLLESRDAGELHEKLAAKIPPTLPYQSERDRAMAGKLAREPGATNGRTDDYAVMDRLQAGRAGANAPAADQVTRNALANSISVTAGAANVRQKAGAAGSAPAPVPATAPLSPPGAKTAGAEEAKQRDDVSKVGPVTETVTVEAEAPQMATESPSVKPVDKSAVNKSVKDKEANQAQKAPARMVGGMGLADRKADMARAETTTPEPARHRAGLCRPRAGCSAPSIPAGPGRRCRWLKASCSVRSRRMTPTSGPEAMQAFFITLPMRASTGLKSRRGRGAGSWPATSSPSNLLIRSMAR
jgi:hypothetical protein